MMRLSLPKSDAERLICSTEVFTVCAKTERRSNHPKVNTPTASAVARIRYFIFGLCLFIASLYAYVESPNFFLIQPSSGIFSDTILRTSLSILQSAFKSVMRSSHSYGYTQMLFCNFSKPKRARLRLIRSRFPFLVSLISKMTRRHFPSHFFGFNVYASAA